MSVSGLFYHNSDGGVVVEPPPQPLGRHSPPAALTVGLFKGNLFNLPPWKIGKRLKIREYQRISRQVGL